MDTLVLSHAYEPVARVGWQRAICLLWEGKVEVVEEYQDRTVRSVTLEIKVPSIIRFLRAIRNRKRAVKFSRENVYARDHGSCQYCGRRLARPEATYDHVIPRSRGGQTRWDNVVICCVPCNQRKGGRTPEEAGMQLRSIPVKPKSLPETLRLTFLLDKCAPPSWRQFARAFHYWQDELEGGGT
jgi:5-methylcytosine-specific restriction endonuclease McrA